MTLPQTIVDALDRFGDCCAEQLQTGAKLVERNRLMSVLEQHMRSPKPEWATLDTRWLLQYLRTNTTFNADAVGEMIEFAQAAAATRQDATSLAYQGSDDERATERPGRHARG